MIRDQFGDVTLYNGDALAVLSDMPDESVDAVLTDPPYSSGGVTITARQADPASKYQKSGTMRRYPPMLGDAKDQRSWTAWCMIWLGQCWRVARDGSPLMVFTDWRQLPAMSDAVQGAGWKWLGIVPWDKRNARPQIGKFRQQCEYVLYACKGSLLLGTRACLPGLYSCPVVSAQKVHLTSKPVSLIRELLAITRSDGIVLDPFMGGGSVGIACREAGRGYVGIELSPEYYAISRERIRKI
ncbi:MAG: site-specific DNA-methyltransferase [Desulfovibrio sp.]|nr:site-specific DNA-methyltransferase [Desulfovibrio sp.]